jgi:UDP:flavonoid glycosyltransferase YjiC (YdhE family)
MMGGSETVYFETAKLLKDNGHDVVFFSTKEKKTLNEGINDYFIEAPDLKKNKFANSFRFIYSKEAKQKLETLIINEKPDIAHLHIF